MSWVVRVYGPHTGSPSPFGASYPVTFDQHVVEKKKHIRRYKDGLLRIKTMAYTRTYGSTSNLIHVEPSKVYYPPGQVHRYVVYRKKEEGDA